MLLYMVKKMCTFNDRPFQASCQLNEIQPKVRPHDKVKDGSTFLALSTKPIMWLPCTKDGIYHVVVFIYCSKFLSPIIDVQKCFFPKKNSCHIFLYINKYLTLCLKKVHLKDMKACNILLSGYF